MNEKVFRDYTDEINEFFRKSGVRIDPLPKLELRNGLGQRFNPFVPTGNYRGDDPTITLYVAQRHVKDILRSYCHELVHHSQNLRDPVGFAALNKAGNLSENSALEKTEAEAYKKGNLLFRKWTEETER